MILIQLHTSNGSVAASIYASRYRLYASVENLSFILEANVAYA